jgi:RNA polymerase sigma-70 factor (ECF subfamily)
VQRYQPILYRLAYRILGRHEDAEDAIQETFLRIYQNLASQKESGKFWPWARQIGINICLKRLSPEFPSSDVERLIESAQPVENPIEDDLLSRIEIEGLHSAIAELPDMYRTVVVLRYFEDLPSVEIAELLGKPASTVRVQLHRALNMLCETLDARTACEGSNLRK